MPPRLPRGGLPTLPRPRPSPTSRSSSSSSSTTTSTVRPFYPLLPPRTSHPPKKPELAVDHLVIGAGVVGLAVARELSKRWPDKTTYLVERRKRWGEETSSRNSEVIHAGLYYPRDSLRTALCLRGREAMYDYCVSRSIPHRQLGKLVVGPASSSAYFEKLASHCSSLQPPSLRPPVRLIDGDEARSLEPDLGENIGAALLSERTGIVSSHHLMESLEADIVDSEGGEVVYDTRVVSVAPSLPSSKDGSGGKRGGDASEEGFVVQTLTGEEEEADALLARVVVNTSGLASNALLNSLLRDGHFGSAPTEWATEGSGVDLEERAKREGKVPLGAWYCKGNYASYKGPGVKRVRRLIYPTPDMGGGSSHQGLGTHLTLDLDGNVRFGPDVEWLHPPGASTPSTQDFWSANLPALQPVPGSSLPASASSPEHRLAQMVQAINSYLPHVALEGLTPDYAGIRPKLVPPGSGFRDFGVLWHESRRLEEQRVWQPLLSSDGASSGGSLRVDEAWRGSDKGGRWEVGGERTRGGAMITLTGIESPGLTSSLGISELVADAVGKRVWLDSGLRDKEEEEAKMRRGRGRRERGDEASDLDAWG